eukprot:m51a1_g1504 hypothetical protein (511) ;mRNA; f:373843-375876
MGLAADSAAAALSLKDAVFEYPVPRALVCPVHAGLLVEPVIGKCSHTVCRECAERTGTCPLCSAEFIASSLLPNPLAAELVAGLRVRCRYGTRYSTLGGAAEPDDSGSACPEYVRLSALAAHERTCGYAFVGCPRGCGVRMRRRDLPAHQRSCVLAREQAAASGDCAPQCAQAAGGSAECTCGCRAAVAALAAKSEQLSTRVEQLGARIEQLMARLDAKTTRVESALIVLRESLESLQESRHGADEQRGQGADQPGAAGAAAAPGEHHNLNCRGTYNGHRGPVWALCISGNTLASASSDTTLWDLRDMKNVRCKATLRGHNDIIYALAFIGGRLFSGSSDKTIRVYDLETFECVATLEGHNHWVRAMTVKGFFLFSGAHNSVKVWDLGTLACVRTLRTKGGSLYSLCTLDPRWLLCGNYNNTIDVWDITDVQNIEHARRLEGHIGAVYSITVLGRRFFSGSYDSSIKMWSADTWQCLQTVVRHTSSVDALAVHANILFSGSADTTIKVWD